jgi:hypothetical protein
LRPVDFTLNSLKHRLMSMLGSELKVGPPGFEPGTNRL